MFCLRRKMCDRVTTKISTELRLTLAFGVRQGMPEVGGTGRW